MIWLKKIIVFVVGWLIKHEKERILGEAQSLLQEAKSVSNDKTIVYCQYEPINTNTEAFLYGMQPIYGNKYVISWLMGHKNNLLVAMNTCVANGNDKGVMTCANKLTLINELSIDINNFSDKYETLLRTKKDDSK